MLSDQTIQRLREIDLQALAADYVTIKRSGPQYLCLCPWHKERNPSCRIYPDHVHCYTCGKHASAIDWVMHLEGIGFSAACRVLSERTGVPLDSRPVSRAAMQYAREEAELCKWWWARYRARLRAELDRMLAEDDPLAAHQWRWLTWDPGLAREFQFFRQQVTAEDRAQWKEERAWDKRLEAAWMGCSGHSLTMQRGQEK